MFGNDCRVGNYTGTGVAYTLELGFIPDWIRIRNRTDGDVVFEWFYGLTAAYHYNEASGGDNSLQTSNGVTVFAGEAPNKVMTQTAIDGAITAGARTLTVTGGLFTTELKVGDVIRLISAAGQQDFTVGAIGSATSLTTVEAAEKTHTAGTLIRITPRAPGLTLGTTLSESGKVLDYVALRGNHDNT